MTSRLEERNLYRAEAGWGRYQRLLFWVDLVETLGAGALNYSNTGSNKSQLEH